MTTIHRAQIKSGVDGSEIRSWVSDNPDILHKKVSDWLCEYSNSPRFVILSHKNFLLLCGAKILCKQPKHMHLAWDMFASALSIYPPAITTETLVEEETT